MITINNSIELLTASINEAYKENDGLWEKVLILRFPKSEFSSIQAVQYAEEANTVTNVTETRVVTYSVTDIIDKKDSSYCTDIWLLNPSITVTSNLADELEKVEEMLSQTATEEQIANAIAEGVNSIDN